MREAGDMGGVGLTTGGTQLRNRRNRLSLPLSVSCLTPSPSATLRVPAPYVRLHPSLRSGRTERGRE